MPDDEGLKGDMDVRPAGTVLAREAAAIVGVSASTWRSYVARREETLAPAVSGHVGTTALWDRAEVEAWQAGRRGRGLIRDGKTRRPRTDRTADSQD